MENFIDTTYTEPATEEILFCDCCGERALSRTTVYDGNETENYCQECVDEHCFRCPDCDEYYRTKHENYIYYDGVCICYSCSDNYRYCQSCERSVYYEDYNSYRDRCCSCADDNDTGVEDYHESDYWEYIGDEKKYWRNKWRGLGIELEIDRSNKDSDVERDTVRAIRDIYDNLKFEYDGSLDNGFEIITHPHTLDAFAKIDWDGILRVCKENGYLSHDAETCGLHIHFSRTMFGSNEKRQANAISKLISFFEAYWDDVLRISRRSQSQADQYATRYGITDIGRIKALGKDKDKGRYFAINNSNRETVEIRLMRGTLNCETFYACLDFCINLVKKSRVVLWKEVSDASKWLCGLEPATMRYIKSRNAFTEVTAQCV